MAKFLSTKWCLLYFRNKNLAHGDRVGKALRNVAGLRIGSSEGERNERGQVF